MREWEAYSGSLVKRHTGTCGKSENLNILSEKLEVQRKERKKFSKELLLGLEDCYCAH